MLESLRHQVYLPAVFIVFGIVVLFGALGLWGVHRSTGRPIREMLALLAAAFVAIGFMGPLVLFFDEWLKSDDLAIREVAKTVLYCVFLPIVFAIWWVFNRLSKHNRKVDSHRRTRHPHEPIT